MHISDVTKSTSRVLVVLLPSQIFLFFILVAIEMGV